MNGNDSIREALIAIIWAFIAATIVHLILPDITISQAKINAIIYISVVSILFIVVWLILARYFHIRISYSLAIIGIFITAVLYLTFSSGLVTVPDLTGKSQDEAILMLEKEGLNVEISYKEVNDTALLHKVISQDPQGGLLVKKSTVIYIVLGKSKPAALNITEPSEGATVTEFTTVKGTVGNLSPDSHLYVLIQPQSMGSDGPYEWWVETTPIIIGGNWECNANIGTTHDANRKFKIVAIITRETLNVGRYGFNLPPYDNICSITVTRQ